MYFYKCNCWHTDIKTFLKDRLHESNFLASTQEATFWVIFFPQKLIFKLCRVDAKWYFKNTHLKKECTALLGIQMEPLSIEGILPKDTEKITSS